MHHRRRVILPILLLATIGCVVLLLAGMNGVARAQSGFALRKHERVVFYGDSITDQRLYTTFVEDYVVTRFPHLNVRFIASGWSGDRVTGGAGGSIDQRLQRDVIAYRPSTVTIMLGMNDAGYLPWDDGLFEMYAHGYQHLVEEVKQALPGVRLTLIQPSPFDDATRPPTFDGGYNGVIERYGRFVQDLAARSGATTADLNRPVVASLQRAESLDSRLARKIIPDRAHPAPGGHLLLAAALLKAWNAPPVVTAVTIDATGRRVTEEENTHVMKLQAAGRLSWTQQDRALPMPLDKNDTVLQLALRASDVGDSLNQQPLRVTGLAAPRFRLAIDGEEVGSFTREELANGVNLAVLTTPMTRQAQQVHGLTISHNDIHFVRWRQVQVPLRGNRSKQLPRALQALDALEEDLVNQQRAAARPRPHRYELVPQS